LSPIHRNPAHSFAVSSGIALTLLSTILWAKETTLTVILSGLDQVSKFQKMDNRKTYELDARSVKVTGFPDDFLRRRTPAEIIKSGLSGGCGDHAFAFYSLVVSKGFQAIYIDSVALTYGAIENTDSGHTGVAIKDRESGNWILVDPTSNKIVSGDWDPESRIYESPVGRFWIGYKGPLDQYPIIDHPRLRKFYGETLKTVPKEIWEKELLAFDFILDDSMKTKDGVYTNPNMEAFLARTPNVLKSLGIHPSRTVKVILKPWNKKQGKDDVVLEADGSWTCFIQDRANLSAHFTDYIQNRIARNSKMP